MSSTLIPRDTLMAALIAKSAAAADAEAKPTAKQEAVAMADAHLNNAALPSYSEAIEALRRLQMYCNTYLSSVRVDGTPCMVAKNVLYRAGAAGF